MESGQLMNRILVTGGSGFVGINLLKKLQASNQFELSATFNNSINFYKIPDVKYRKVNLENKIDCDNITKNVDIVVMCAANSSGAMVMEKTPLVHLTPNIIMNLKMLEAAYKNNVKKFIFISSNTVYPFVDFAVEEKDACFDFFSKYYVVGWMKRFSEVVCDIYSSKIKNPMKCIVVRPGNLYGPHDKFDPEKSKVIPSLIRKVISGGDEIVVWGDGSDLKDFLYIDDFVNAIYEILNLENLNNNIINVASGQGVTIKKVLNTILKIENKKNFKIIFDTSKPTMIPKRLINIDLARKILNFKPQISLDDGLARTIDWYKSSLL